MTRASRSQKADPPEFRPRAGSANNVMGASTRAGWRIVIADQSEARLYSADAALSSLLLLATVRNPSARKPDRDLLTSRGGSKFNRSSGNYQALAPAANVHRQEMTRFAKSIAAVAARGLARGERLALIASPRLLATITSAMTTRAGAAVSHLVSRDVTHESASRLRIRLRRVLG